MINVIKLNQIGSDGNNGLMNFTFSYDNKSDLPHDGIYQMGEKVYVIANGSIAINSKTNESVKFSNGKWIRNNDKITPNDTTITENGDYSLPNNDITGNNNVTVDIHNKPILIEKSIRANGTYNAVDEGVNGYSKVNVSLQAKDCFNYAHLYTLPVSPLLGKQVSNSLQIYSNKEDTISFINSYTYSGAIVFINPIKKITLWDSIGYVIMFSPTADFDGFYDKYNNKITDYKSIPDEFIVGRTYMLEYQSGYSSTYPKITLYYNYSPVIFNN